MKFRVIAFLFVFILITACNKSNDEIPKLDGFYTLVDISCECRPASFIPNQQQIKIDFDQNKLIVKNFGEVIPDRFHQKGEFNFKVEGNIVNLDGIDFEFTKTLNCLIFDSASPSGYDSFPTFEFRKN